MESRRKSSGIVGKVVAIALLLAAIATIGADGAMKAIAAGDVTITVTDAGGRKAASLPIHVIADNGGGGNGGGGGGGACPIGDPETCKQICAILPSLPFCQ